jgi:hypothetical protein
MALSVCLRRLADKGPLCVPLLLVSWRSLEHSWPLPTFAFFLRISGFLPFCGYVSAYSIENTNYSEIRDQLLRGRKHLGNQTRQKGAFCLPIHSYIALFLRKEDLQQEVIVKATSRRMGSRNACNESEVTLAFCVTYTMGTAGISSM